MAQIEIDGETLVIRVPLNVAGSDSKSGKSRVLDSTNGFVGLATGMGMVKVGLNVITSDANWSGGRKAAPTPALVKRA